MRLQCYHFVVKYKIGPTLHLAGTLSQATLPQSVRAQVTNFDVFRMEMEFEYETRNSRLTGTTKHQLREETSKDVTLTTLYKVIVHGWPADRAVTPSLCSPTETVETSVSTEWHNL